jgi:hypothetical protein
MHAQSASLAESVLAQIMPAIQQVIAPIVTSHNATPPVPDAVSTEAVALSTPVNRSLDPKEADPRLQPSLMSASPRQPDDSVVKMPISNKFSSLANELVFYLLLNPSHLTCHQLV